MEEGDQIWYQLDIGINLGITPVKFKRKICIRVYEHVRGPKFCSLV